MSNIRKEEFVHRLADRTGFSLKEVKHFLAGLLAEIETSLQDKDVIVFTGFGKLGCDDKSSKPYLHFSKSLSKRIKKS